MTFDDRTTSDWQALDSAHHMAPFTDYGEIRKHGARIITHAEGHHIFDTDGNLVVAELVLLAREEGRDDIAKALAPPEGTVNEAMFNMMAIPSAQQMIDDAGHV